MSDTSVDQFLRDLSAELSVEPSADLAARVRGHVSRSARPRSLRRWTTAAAVVIVTGAVAMSVAPNGRPEPGSSLRQPAIASPIQPRGVVQGPVAPVLSTASPRLQETRSASARKPARPSSSVVASGPEVLVPPDQAIALRSILAAMRTGRSLVPPAAVVTLDADGRLPAPAQIDIPEIIIERLWPPANGGGSRER